MKFKAIVYDTEDRKPLHLGVNWINVANNKIGCENGLQYSEFRLFHVSKKYRDGNKLIYQTLTDTEIQDKAWNQ